MNFNESLTSILVFNTINNDRCRKIKESCQNFTRVGNLWGAIVEPLKVDFRNLLAGIQGHLQLGYLEHGYLILRVPIWYPHDGVNMIKYLLGINVRWSNWQLWLVFILRSRVRALGLIKKKDAGRDSLNAAKISREISLCASLCGAFMF